MLPSRIHFQTAGTLLVRAADLAPVFEIEEDVYSYTDAKNGAGPMWCSGSTTLVRAGDHVFASGSKLRIGATKKIHGEGFKRPWPPLIKMDAAVKSKVNSFVGNLM